MNKFEYAGFEIDFSALPQASLDALLRRGAVHFLGNEQASKVAAKVKSHEATGWATPATDEQKAAWKAEFVANAVKALVEGTIGVRAVGTGTGKPKLSRLDSTVRKLAKAWVVKTLADNKLAIDKTTKTVKTGQGEFTMEQLIDRRVERGGEELQKEAAKLIAAEDRIAAKQSEGAGADVL